MNKKSYQAKKTTTKKRTNTPLSISLLNQLPELSDCDLWLSFDPAVQRCAGGRGQPVGVKAGRVTPHQQQGELRGILTVDKLEVLNIGAVQI